MEFVTYETTNPDSDAKIDAFIVEEPNTVATISGPVEVDTGKVLVRTNRPDVYEVHDISLLDSYAPANVDETEEVIEADYVDFDPAVHTASEVARYLSSNISPEEYERVVELEQQGANRRSAIPSRH